MTRPESVAPRHRRRAYFVYYRVARSDAGRLQVAFAQAASTGLPAPPWRAELMVRAEPAEPAGASPAAEAPSAVGHRPQPDLQTWMEIYWLDDGSDAIDWADGPLRGQIEARARVAGVHDLVHGERHYEAFESCA